MESTKAVLKWVEKNWSKLTPEILQNLQSLETPREWEIASKFSSFEIPEWCVEPKQKKRAKRRLIDEEEDDVPYRVKIDGKYEYFRVVNQDDDGMYTIAWFYDETSLDKLKLKRGKTARMPLMPGCFVTSNHLQENFSMENTEMAPGISIVGSLDVDKKTVELDSKYLNCMRVLKTVLARGGGETADAWSERVWEGHRAVNNLSVEDISPVANHTCSVCNLKRTVSSNIRIGEATYSVGCECMEIVNAALRVVKTYNNEEYYIEAMDELTYHLEDQ
jgi:hypothetical protein